ncbi:MAG: LysR family transcriptional regulator [Rhodospirillales bacterium]
MDPHIGELRSLQTRFQCYKGSDMIGSKVNDILVFLSVVETGSFVAGGKAFGLSRSTAGKAVARLEERYGARLLNRTTRALDLTQEGRSLYEQGQAIKTAIEAADESVAGDPATPHGTLRIAAPDGLGRRLLLPTVYRYLEAWPQTQIEMSFSDRVDSLVEEGFDLSIRISVQPPEQGFVVRTLLRSQALLCAAPSYFETRDRPLNAEQLSRHDLLQFASRHERQVWALQEADGTSFRAQGHVRLRCDNAEALRETALAGRGIALLTRIMVEKDIVEGRLEHVLPQMKFDAVPLVALYPHRRLLDARVRRFIDMLSDDLRE